MEFLEHWKPLRREVYRFLRTYVYQKDLVEDVLQQVLLEAMESYHTLKDKDKFRAWIFAIARRTANRMIKVQHRIMNTETMGGKEGGMELDRMENTVFNEPHQVVEVRDTLSHALRELDPYTVYLLGLRYYHDLPIAEISSMTGIKEGTLRSQYSRVLKSIQRKASLSYEQG